MTTVLLLARHGESDWNRERRWQGFADRPLTDVGHRQALALAEQLAPYSLGAVYSSDLERARDTARVVAERQGLPLMTLPALREVDVGTWAGLSRAEAEARDPEGFRRWLAGGKGWHEGEAYPEMARRVVEAVTQIGREHAGELVLIVTHAGPVRAMHAAALGMDIRAYRRIRPVEPNARLSAVCWDGAKLTRACPAGQIDELVRTEELAGLAVAAPPPSPAG